MRLSHAAELLGVRLQGGDAVLRGFCTDSRAIQPRNLFVALRGASTDGHEFIGQARLANAAGALVERSVGDPLPQLVVEESVRALGILGSRWRERFSLPLIGITGSNGKTTVKEMVALILSQEGPVLGTRGNLNNEIGLPLTLGRLDEEHRWAVVEMGANHPGEIRRLAALAKPDVGVITQCARAHLEGFGSLEGVARAKGELLEALDASGVAVLNADDDFFPLWKELVGQRPYLRFGLEGEAEVRARWKPEGDGTRVQLSTPAGTCELLLSLPGRHNVMNAMAAAAASLAAGASLEAVRAGLEQMRAVGGRLETKRAVHGARVVDDTYNANPTSLAAGLSVLGSLSGRRWLVLGDMGELGDGAEELHAEAGRAARAAGVERLYAFGPLSGAATSAFGRGGRHFDSQEELIESLRSEVNEDVTMLVKGSRSMHMERVVNALVGEA